LQNNPLKRTPLIFKTALLAAFGALLFLPFVITPPVKVIPEVIPPVVEIEPVTVPIKKIETYVPVHEVTLPDFAAISDIKTKKSQFFAFLTPHIDAENARLLAQRIWLIAVQKQYNEQLQLAAEDEKALNALYKLYRINFQTMSTQKGLRELLQSIDQLPKTLVLMQAANESAWGTSRFARLGLNFFGEWCYVKDCGVIPNGRPVGMAYEVKAFMSVSLSVKSYFKNINTNNAYRLLREIRAQFRENDLPLQAKVLATGLIQYSSRGDHYVNEISQMINYNAKFVAD
jgi:Bax protein